MAATQGELSKTAGKPINCRGTLQKLSSSPLPTSKVLSPLFQNQIFDESFMIILVILVGC